ncbi:MAG: linear amide C-N hydrolase [Clostridia bacterium]|nr:linear amide C-N hydrolase [Clostridia bacterium]
MCTAIHETKCGHLLGRTLDLEKSYGECVLHTPRKFSFAFRHEGICEQHLEILGVGIVQNGFPLYFDAMNDSGLCAAGLNFPGNAVYQPPCANRVNLASFELIPYILSYCRDVKDAETVLQSVNITADSFSAVMPPSPLHWIFADKERCIVAEPMQNGLILHENRFGVLTNNPPFPYHEWRLTDCMGIGADPLESRLCPGIDLTHYSRGAGGIGLPGDFSSSSRFIRAVFAKNHTAESSDPVSRFFRMMDTVSIPNGCVKTETGENVRTVYTSCADTETMTYYFTTYTCRHIRAVRMTETLADKEILSVFPMDGGEDYKLMNP